MPHLLAHRFYEEAYHTYIGKLYICEGGGCAKLVYAGGQRIAIKQVSSGLISYFHPDHLGFTSVLTNGSGTKEEDLVYYPYGETYTNTGTANVAYKYTGKELDNSTSLCFYEARYYDAVLGGLFQRIPLSPIPPILRLLIAIPTYSIIPCGLLIP